MRKLLVIRVILARDDVSWDTAGDPITLPYTQISAYLDADPRHAVIFPDRQKYIIRGAGEDLSNFYWGDLPAEDPNDAEGGDLTSMEAIEACLKD